VAEKVSQTAFAKLVGVSRQRVAALVKRGTITLDKDGRIDPDEATAALRASLDPARPSKIRDGVDPPGGDPRREAPTAPDQINGTPQTLNSAKTVLEVFRAKKAKLEYEEAAGLLVERSVVEREAYAEGRAVRDAFMSLGGRLRDRLSIETDPVAIHQIIDAEVRRVLVELAEGARTTTGGDLGYTGA